MKDMYVKSLLRKKYVLEVMCSKCGSKRRGETTKLRDYQFKCFKCGAFNKLQSSKGVDNCKYKVLYEKA